MSKINLLIVDDRAENIIALEALLNQHDINILTTTSPNEALRICWEKDIAIADLSIAPRDVAEIVALVAAGELTDKLARQVVEGVIAGEGKPKEVIAARGIKVVSDEGELVAAIERAIAAQPETAQKVRDGNIPAAGALIGAVMKDTKGQADAARVRELLLGLLGQS